MSLLIPESGLFLWMLLAFVVVLVVLGKFGWPIMTKMIDERARYIDESIAKAKEANEKLEKIQEETAAMLKEAQEKQSSILAEAVNMRNQIVEKAKTDATLAGQKILEEAKQQIEAEKEDAIRDIRRQVGLLSVEIAEKVLRQNLKSDTDQMAMIDRMLDEIKTEK
ncbi:MAG: F0F1 ATP synthase subunit B [Bacteroidales bacterium]|jgi:F-type H+-transporting ATPase subunit b|nr:F0F1 ATP synthase subunit B [Bacteroidales bacterium]MBO7378187.1 F0F1 ATP synthase subunit B [Bacteroidales bacterium]MBP5213082.1 F0F1 ATP synthase subunit B [Bacteroidales bacterium]MBP5763606.1 F0F1 ATP synthase subunit B [Bacteroidales bacterium]